MNITISPVWVIVFVCWLFIGYRLFAWGMDMRESGFWLGGKKREGQQVERIFGPLIIVVDVLILAFVTCKMYNVF